jgi:uncharacterized lipoprotein YbaY
MKLQLSLTARDLTEAAPYVAVLTCGGATIGETAASSATVAPVWKDLVTADLPPDALVQVQVCQADDTKRPVATATFALAEILRSPYHASAQFSTEQGDGGAKIALHAEEQQDGRLSFQLAARDLPDTDFGFSILRKQHTDPFFEVYSAVSGKMLLRSNVVEDDLNPVWDAVEVGLDDLCGNKKDWPIRFTVLDMDGSGETEYLGQATLTLAQLLGEDTLLKHHPLAKGGFKSVGSLMVKSSTCMSQTTVGRTAQRYLETVCVALEANRGKLVEQASLKADAAQDAASTAATAQLKADGLHTEADVLASKQHEARTALSTVHAKHQALVATAKTQPFGGKVVLQLKAANLPDTDFGLRNKTDPIYEIFVQGQTTKACCSNIVENSLNPTWDEQTIDLAKLGGALTTPLEIVVSDKDGGKKQSKIASVVSSIQELQEAATNRKNFQMMQGELSVIKAEVTGYVDNAAHAAEFGMAQLAPAQKLYTEASTAFETAHKAAETALQEAAQAKEAATQAHDDAEAARQALEMLEKATA